MTFLVPQLAATFKSLVPKLPRETEVLVALSNIFVRWWYLSWACPAVARRRRFIFGRTNEKAQRRLDEHHRSSCRCWASSGRRSSSRASRPIFAMLYRAGISVLDCIQICEKIVGNRVMEEGLQRVGRSISEGQGISQAFIATKLFPPLVLRMLRVGESTGGARRGAAERELLLQPRRCARASRACSSCWAPPPPSILGMLIVGILYSIFLPIYDVIAQDQVLARVKHFLYLTNSRLVSLVTQRPAHRGAARVRGARAPGRRTSSATSRTLSGRADAPLHRPRRGGLPPRHDPARGRARPRGDLARKLAADLPQHAVPPRADAGPRARGPPRRPRDLHRDHQPGAAAPVARDDREATRCRSPASTRRRSSAPCCSRSSTCTSPHTLLVTFTPGDAMRQSYFRDREIKFSRLTPIDLEEGQSLGTMIAEETTRTWQYLDSLRHFGARRPPRGLRPACTRASARLVRAGAARLRAAPIPRAGHGAGVDEAGPEAPRRSIPPPRR